MRVVPRTWLRHSSRNAVRSVFRGFFKLELSGDEKEAAKKDMGRLLD